MAHFEATVRLFDVIESNAPAARRALEERLRAAGFTRWQILGVTTQGTVARVAEPRRRTARRRDVSYAGGVLVAAAVVWTLWFLWLLAG
jgi:hypothetical protein